LDWPSIDFGFGEGLAAGVAGVVAAVPAGAVVFGAAGLADFLFAFLASASA